MGLFFSKEEKEVLKKAKLQEKAKKEKAKEIEDAMTSLFVGTALQPIGKIPVNGCCSLKLMPKEKVLNIHQGQIDITLPYDRIISFKLEDETKFCNSGSGLGSAIVGGVLFGGAGAIVGQNMKKGKAKKRWIGILTYKDKAGEIKELHFIQWGVTGEYTGENKQIVAMKFEAAVNKIGSANGENITEL